MGKRRLNNWRWWLQTISFALLLIATFAPLSEALHGIFLAMSVGGTLVYLATDSSASRKWLLRSLIALAAFMLLAVLLSFGRGWVFVGILVVWAAITSWEFVEEGHAEYLMQRYRRQRCR